MGRRVASIVVAVAVLAVGALTAVTVAITDDDRDSFGHRDSMTSSPWREESDWPGHWQHPGSQEADRARPGQMHEMLVGSEYAYLAEMIAHHEEAVTAARQLKRSQRAEMREFGQTIIASQSAQIDQMKQWLATWYAKRPGRVDYQPMMRDLTGLSTDRLDRAFLQDMIGHHMGAVMMSQQLLMGGAVDHEAVEVLAETIRDEQHAEILQMQRWLREWF